MACSCRAGTRVERRSSGSTWDSLHAVARVHVWDLVEDKAGTMWIATSVGLSRRFRDGRIANYQAHPTQAGGAVWALEIDDTGRIWAGLDDGVVVFHPPSVRGHKRPASVGSTHPRDDSGWSR